MTVLLSIIVVLQFVAILNSAPLSSCVDQQQCFQLIQGSQQGLVTLRFMYSFPACCTLKNGQIDSNGICTAGNDQDLFTDRSIRDCGTSQPYFTFIAKDGSKCESPPTNPIYIAGPSETPLLSTTCYSNPEGCNTQQNCQHRVGGTWTNDQCFCSQNACSNPIDPTVCLSGCKFKGKRGSSSTAQCDVSCLCPGGIMEPKACSWNVNIPTSWCPAVQSIMHSSKLSNNEVPVVELEVPVGNSQDSRGNMEWIYVGLTLFCIIGCVLATYWLWHKQKVKAISIQQHDDDNKEMIGTAINSSFIYRTFK